MILRSLLHNRCLLRTLYIAGWVLSYASWAVNGDADFESVRVLMMQDSSGRGGDPKEKYWRKFIQLGMFRGETRRLILFVKQMNLRKCDGYERTWRTSRC